MITKKIYIYLFKHEGYCLLLCHIFPLPLRIDRIHETHSLYNVLKCVTLFLLHDFFF